LILVAVTAEQLLALTKLFTCSARSQLDGYVFVNPGPVADGKKPDVSRPAIRFVNYAKPPDSNSPQPRQFADQRCSGKRIGA
jgi:hypothetical protein